MNLHEVYLNYAATLPSDTAVQKRVERAYRMLKEGSGYTINSAPRRDGKLIYQVHKLATSLVGEDTYYHIIDNTCDCPDWDNAPGRLCKHVMAVTMREMLQA